MICQIFTPLFSIMVIWLIKYLVNKAQLNQTNDTEDTTPRVLPEYIYLANMIKPVYDYPEAALFYFMFRTARLPQVFY